MNGMGMYCMSMKQNKMREEMKEAFINALKEEQIPWHCDWVRMGRPENAVTGKQYRGVNSIWLSYTQDRKGYQDPRWCTFKQAQKEGWKVKKGEKGARVEFWSLYDTETKQKISGGKVAELREQLGDDFYDRVKPISSVYTVFNAEQIEGIPERMTERAQSLLPEELLAEKRDVLLKNMGLSFKEGGNEAFYQPRNDQITMPEMEQFRSVYGYMSTFLHEAGHATGHESRLNRNIKNSFGTPDYAREELRAEIASAFVSQDLGTIQAEPEHMENHKAYIQDWITVLEKDPNELFAAILDAEKISDYLMEKGEFGKEEVKEEVKEAGRVDSNTVTEQELLKKESIGKSSPAGIPEGQEQGPDISFYASQGFDRWQLEKIRTGLEQGLDVSLYASLDFRSGQMNMILLGLQEGYDVSVYARPEFSSSQMMEILNGLEAGADIAVYADPKFNSMQMMEIRKGLEAELNASSYADPKFSPMQMNLIREGLEEGLDVSVFARPEFNYSQMAEIKLGLNEGQDISSYCNPDMDAKEMNRIRLEQKFSPLNEQTAQGLKDNLDVRDNSMELSTEQIYRQMSDGERELYDMSLDYGDMEGAGRILEEKRRELQQETGKDQPQQLKADPEQTDSRIDYSVIQNVAEMEIKLNLPSEERMTEWLDDNTSMFKTKSGVKASDLQKRYEEFQNHHMPLLGIQEASKLRLVAKGRDVEGFHPDPVHLQMAQILRGYQDNGMDIKDVIRNKIGEIMERTGQTDPDYVKNAVCSIASKDRSTYEEYKNIISSHEREMSGMERQDSIFHGNKKDGVPEFFRNRNPKTPVQGQQRQIMRGMGR